MKKLPSIYKQEINKKINNNTTVYYCTSKNEKKEVENLSIRDFLDNLFNEDGYIFNKALIIKTKDNTYDTAIVKKESEKIYTLTDNIIRIEDIISIERK